jgi:hypothetical protein
VEGIIHRQINNIQQVDDIPEILKEYFHSIEVLKEAGSMISSNTPVSLQGLSEMKQKDFKGLPTEEINAIHSGHQVRGDTHTVVANSTIPLDVSQAFNRRG